MVNIGVLSSCRVIMICTALVASYDSHKNRAVVHIGVQS